ncbi:MAG: hypothetical protein ACKVRP_14000 [Bacteroidota bacterium]
MEWITKLPSGAMFAGRIDDSFKTDDAAFVMEFMRVAMKARLGSFHSSDPEYSMKFIKQMAAPSRTKSVAEIVALEKLAEAAIAWKNGTGDSQFDILYQAVEEFECRERGRVSVPDKKHKRG